MRKFKRIAVKVWIAFWGAVAFFRWTLDHIGYAQSINELFDENRKELKLMWRIFSSEWTALALFLIGVGAAYCIFRGLPKWMTKEFWNDATNSLKPYEYAFNFRIKNERISYSENETSFHATLENISNEAAVQVVIATVICRIPEGSIKASAIECSNPMLSGSPVNISLVAKLPAPDREFFVSVCVNFKHFGNPKICIQAFWFKVEKDKWNTLIHATAEEVKALTKIFVEEDKNSPQVAIQPTARDVPKALAGIELFNACQILVKSGWKFYNQVLAIDGEKLIPEAQQWLVDLETFCRLNFPALTDYRAILGADVLRYDEEFKDKALRVMAEGNPGLSVSIISAQIALRCKGLERQMEKIK